MKITLRERRESACLKRGPTQPGRLRDARMPRREEGRDLPGHFWLGGGGGASWGHNQDFLCREISHGVSLGPS